MGWQHRRVQELLAEENGNDGPGLEGDILELSRRRSCYVDASWKWRRVKKLQSTWICLGAGRLRGTPRFEGGGRMGKLPVEPSMASPDGAR